MKESIGYTVTLNIVITFIIIVFAFLSAALIYFKSNKISNLTTEIIEKREGYSSVVKNEISSQLSSIGYNKKPVNCTTIYNKIDSKLLDGKYINGECSILSSVTGSEGYCVFVCTEYDEPNDECYYYYKISTNMMINIPIINDLLDIPIFSNTNRLYDFEDQITCKKG